MPASISQKPFGQLASTYVVFLTWRKIRFAGSEEKVIAHLKR
jgi:hypothetical protein